MTNFRNLKIWQKGMELVLDVYEICKILPNEEKFGLRSQLTRAAVAIPSNIAEGSSRNSAKDFKRFLEISLGSSFELETQLLIVEKLNISKMEKFSSIIDKLHEEQKMINGFIKTLKN